jgi:hypothetical protein
MHKRRWTRSVWYPSPDDHDDKATPDVRALSRLWSFPFALCDVKLCVALHRAGEQFGSLTALVAQNHFEYGLPAAILSFLARNACPQAKLSRSWLLPPNFAT